MKKNLRLVIGIAAAIIAISIGTYYLLNPGNQSETAFLEKHGLSGLSVEEIVQKLDSTTSDPDGLGASITSEYLILKDSEGEIKLVLPEGKFYLSFAPYINGTHPCATHSLISCQGELVNQKIHATVTDRQGKEIVNSDMTTMENGFVGLWLPRNIEATVTVFYNDLTAQAVVTTHPGSDTCLTTPLQLN